MNDCPFCNINNAKDDIVWESKHSIAILDRYPVSPGHTLVIPKRHIKSYFDLTQDEVDELWDTVKNVKETIDYMYKPDGYNIGINIGEAAGQTIPHCHIHVIPRYKGDVEDPLGGVRGVIPEKRIYINDKQ